MGEEMRCSTAVRDAECELDRGVREMTGAQDWKMGSVVLGC